MDITTLENDIKVYYVAASSFPDGVQQAHETLHALMPYDPKRGYYGISYPEGGTISYKAAAAELHEGELAGKGLPTFIIKKGEYLYRDIHDFMQHIPEIGATFQELIADDRIDPQGACVEWYMNNKDCRCMARMK